MIFIVSVSTIKYYVPTDGRHIVVCRLTQVVVVRGVSIDKAADDVGATRIEGGQVMRRISWWLFGGGAYSTYLS